MTFFLLVDLFNVVFFSFWGAKSVADIDTGGAKIQNPYISTDSQCYHYSFCLRGGPNSIDNFDGGGAWPDLSILDLPLSQGVICRGWVGTHPFVLLDSVLEHYE